MIPEAELQKITAKYDALLAVSLGLLKDDDRQLLENAFVYSRELYGESRHLTGELLISHCLSIARIAVEEMGLGINSMVAALLHDAFITRSVSIEDIRKKYGAVIADIDVGKNIGAFLQMDQANADKNIAQARAEERRAMAVAREQEMRAKAEESRANLIQAEAEIPKAIAEAFRSGNLGIMDYQRYQNIKADTRMRDSIAEPPRTKPKKGIKDDDKESF